MTQNINVPFFPTIYPTFSSLPTTAVDGATAVTLDTHGIYVYNLGLTSWVSASGGGGITVYPNLASFPGTATTGAVGVAADTQIIYEWNGSAWVAVAGPGFVSNAISSLTGDVTASGPGASASHLVATSNSTLTTLSSLSLPGSQVTGTVPAATTAGSATSATNSSNTLVTVATGNTNYPVVLAPTSSTGQQSLLMDTDMTYNPVTDVLTLPAGGATSAGTIVMNSYVVYGVSTISAAGTTQGGATPITTSEVNISAGAANSGVILPSTPTTNGLTITITNSTGNTLYVYPPSGGTIDGGALNASVVIPGGQSIALTLFSANTWSSTSNTMLGGTGIALTHGAGGVSFNLNTPVAIGNGGSGVSSVTTTPAATAFAGWDANKNLSANNLLPGLTSTVTSATPVTLVVGSAETQVFTGSTAQTVNLPVATTLSNGLTFTIINMSTNTTTVQTSGANSIQAMATNTQLVVTCINTAGGTGTASWSWVYGPIASSALPIAIGGTAKTSVTTAPAASSWAGWDANKNLTSNNLLESYTTTATAAGTTTLVVGSTFLQYFTGTSTQTVQLPVATTLANGQQFQIVNNSTGIVTVQTSGLNTIQAIPTNTILTVTCINTAGGTGIASWSWTASAGNGVSTQYTSPNLMVAGTSFEDGTVGGWAATGCASLTNGLPTSVGTSGNPFSSANGGQAKGANTAAPAVTSSSPIDGLYSLNLATSGAGTIGDGYISQVIPISSAYQAKVLTFKCKYKVASGTPVMAGTNANTYALAAYDVTNNTWLGLAGGFNFVQSTGVGEYVGTVQTGITTAGLQIFVYSPVAPTGASSLLLDNFYVGQQTGVNAPAMTDWVAYTPTFTGYGTVSSVNFYSRRVGDSLQVQGQFITGTTTATPNQISIGYNGANANVTVDSTKVQNNSYVGKAAGNEAAGSVFDWSILSANSSNATTVQMSLQSSTSSQATGAQNGSAVANNATFFTLFFQVPISGWSSNTVSSADTDTRVIGFSATGTAGQTTTSSTLTTLIAPTVLRDYAATYNNATGVYTIPVAGFYRLSANARDMSSGATNAAYASFAVTGSLGTTVYRVWQNLAMPTGWSFNGELTLPFAAGDTVAFQYFNAATTPAWGSFFNFSAVRTSGPAVVQATESVNARYYATATSISGSLATIVWTTKDFDSHAAMSSGVYTVPVSGKYQVNTSLAFSGTFALNSQSDLVIQKNGATVSEQLDYSGGIITADHVSLSDTINCLAGDTLRVQLSSGATSPSIVSSNTKNFISIFRVGN